MLDPGGSIFQERSHLETFVPAAPRSSIGLREVSESERRI